jgi:hypothetical protein
MFVRSVTNPLTGVIKKVTAGSRDVFQDLGILLSERARNRSAFQNGSPVKNALAGVTSHWNYVVPVPFNAMRLHVLNAATVAQLAVTAKVAATSNFTDLYNPNADANWTAVTFSGAGNGNTPVAVSGGATTDVVPWHWPGVECMDSTKMARVVCGKIALAWGARLFFGKVGRFHLRHLARCQAFNLGSIPKKAAIGQLYRAHPHPMTKAAK